MLNITKRDGLYDMTQILYKAGKIKNPFTQTLNDVIFADDTASGRPCKIVEMLIEYDVYPYYTNTHSNATCGTMMKTMISNCRKAMRRQMNLDETKKIIFSGFGMTGAINHLVHKINFRKYTKVYIFLSPFEHHSNFLPWKEMANIEKNIVIQLIDVDDSLFVKTKDFIKKLKKLSQSDPQSLIIISMTGCSNVSGRKFTAELDTIWDSVKEIKKNSQIYLLIDYACCGPYMKIDGSKCDGFYLSGHKFLGGQQTPGCLIVNNALLQIDCPYAPGGGCVVNADDKAIIYKKDIETKESGGTPNIVGIVRFHYVLRLNKLLFAHMKYNETKIEEQCTQRMKSMMEKYPTFKVAFFATRKPHDLPIYPVVIENLHFNLVTILLNDLHGIQTRGGISCNGILGRIAEETQKIDGWCRITFSYLMTQKEIDTVFKALEYIVQNGAELSKLYKYDKEQNYFSFREKA